MDHNLDAENASPAGSYIENYKILSEVARDLREQSSVDIDKLVPMVDKALGAYSACKARIESVEKMLAEKLGDGLVIGNDGDSAE